MSHFAKVINGIVNRVIVAKPEFFDTYIDLTPGIWIQTSYNTHGNIHYGADGNPDGKEPLRGNYAGIGYIYNSINDVFYPPKPYNSWLLDETTWIWNPPIPYPTDDAGYIWDEASISWVSPPVIDNSQSQS